MEKQIDTAIWIQQNANAIDLKSTRAAEEKNFLDSITYVKGFT